MTQARINIDSDKFNLILMQRGLKKGELAVEMGHGRNYFSDIVRRRTMPRPTVVYLQRHYNIDPKEYQVVEKEPVEEVKELKEPKPEIPISELTDKQLYRVIYCAVYHAAKRVMEEM